MRSAAIGGLLLLAACGGGSDSTEPEALPTPAAKHETPSSPDESIDPNADGPPDADPEANADPNAESPPDDPQMPPATQADLIKKFAPHLNLHPQEKNMPANVDWFLARSTLRYDHSHCLDHEVLGLGKVTQANLATQTHQDTNLLCRHSGAAKKDTDTLNFFLRVADSKTYAGASRDQWKTYVVWRPKTGGLVDVEYWFFYAYNDGFSIFNHEADWEHLTVTIDPKADDAQGKVTQVFFSEHKAGTPLPAGDAKLTMDGTHPMSYVAIGTHANYPKPGTYEIPGTKGLAKDHALAATATNVWKTESALVLVGTRAAPKNGQQFIKYWGHWGKFGSLPETNGITRHFP
jgi:hypothetical protein